MLRSHIPFPSCNPAEQRDLNSELTLFMLFEDVCPLHPIYILTLFP